MKHINQKQLDERIVNFINKHKGLEKLETSPMMDNQYRKVYHCEDGKCLYEVNRICCTDIEAKFSLFDYVKGKKTIEIKYFETEVWDDDDSTSEYMHNIIKY